jgi:hypothetical protein
MFKVYDSIYNFIELYFFMNFDLQNRTICRIDYIQQD